MKWVAILMLVAGLWIAWTGPKPLDRARAQRATEREVARLLFRYDRTPSLTTALRKARGFAHQPREETQGYTQPVGFPTRVLVFEDALDPTPPESEQKAMTTLEEKLLEEMRAAHGDDTILVIWCSELSPFISLARSALRKSAGEDLKGLIMIVLGEKASEADLRIAVSGSGIEAVSATHY